MADSIECDYLVIGAGVAGLRAAITLAGAGRVLVLAKDSLHESASEYAQGGIAAALSDDDEVSLHEQDTLIAGDGLCDPEAVRLLVSEGPNAIEELLDWGAEFDREHGKLMFGREGAHSRNRILHAHGDSTGKEIARTLYRKAASLTAVRFLSFSAVTDLLFHAGEVQGVLAFDEWERSVHPIYARSVLLATGGLGRLYVDTTNPAVATGDGVAMGWRAGAVVRDIEFIQFHPTALCIPGKPRFLLSEALRGEGAHLRNKNGERFTDELAPRDVVARAIVAEMQRTNSTHVGLDVTHFPAAFIAQRFPRIYQTCLHYKIDLEKEPAPVCPAAHYAMGGLETDLWGKTNLTRLYAAGEVASTGVHGANRLASNSLLEGVVFGARAAQAMTENPATHREIDIGPIHFPEIGAKAIQTLMSAHCGISRDAAGLERALQSLAKAARIDHPDPTRDQYESRNLFDVAQLIAQAAFERRESRGGHYRSDYPQKAPVAKHSRQQMRNYTMAECFSEP